MFISKKITIINQDSRGVQPFPQGPAFSIEGSLISLSYRNR